MDRAQKLVGHGHTEIRVTDTHQIGVAWTQKLLGRTQQVLRLRKVSQAQEPN